MKTGIVLVGKNGDVINAIPIAKHLYDTTGEKPAWVISKMFQSVLFGCSFIEVDAVHYSIHKIEHAMQYAEAKYSRVLNATAWGKHWRGARDKNFNYLSWEHVGYGQHFDDKVGFPLVFDLRDAEREAFLVERYIGDDERQIILTCLGCSKASPFNHASMLQDIIKRKWGQSNLIIDLCGIKAARIYDLLGLFDRAACLVTTDTAALHLATASPNLPVVALVNDNPFLATRPRCNVSLLKRYSEAIPSVSQMHGAIFSALQLAREKQRIENARLASCAG